MHHVHTPLRASTALLLLCIGCGVTADDDDSTGVSDDDDSTAGADDDDSTNEDAVGPYVPQGAYIDFTTVEAASVIGGAGREIPLLIRWASEAPQPLPIVIWSHAGSWREWDEGRRADVGAYVALSAQGAGFSNWYDDVYSVGPVTGTSWDAIVGPMLSITGVFDQANFMTSVDRLKPYENMPPGDKRLLYSADERSPFSHNTFNLVHLDVQGDYVQDLNTAITSSVVAFLDWHLRARPEAQAWLDGPSGAALLGEGGRWEEK